MVQLTSGMKEILEKTVSQKPVLVTEWRKCFTSVVVIIEIQRDLQSA